MATRKSHKLSAALTIGAGLFIFGCATINSPTPGNGTTFEVRDRSYATVWDAAVRTLERRSLVIVVADREAGVLRAENRMDWFSWGQVVGVFIRPTRPDAERYLVEVQSLKRARYAFTGSDWTQSVITGMQADLGDKIPAQVQK
jgi:hypothetical protein